MYKNNRDLEWINTVLRKGTISDKLAAHTLLIHGEKSWSSLNTLIELVDPKKCRRQCMMAMHTLRELFLDHLNLHKRDSQITTEADKRRVRFYYTKFIDQLNLVAFDNLEETRKKAIWVLSQLLTRQCENKEYIVEKLIEKLGDKVPKLATTAGHLVEKAINSESLDLRMKAINCIQRFLRRPNQSANARYYAVSLLTRIKLIKGSHGMANDLIQTYLELYTTLTKENKIESKLMSTILVGIHRAYPYSQLKNDIFERHLQTLYTLVHSVNFRMSVVAMVLIKNIVSKRAQSHKISIEDRFYNLIFGQLMKPELHSCSRQEAFVNILLTAINEDTVLARREAFIKRILQVAVNSRPELAQLLLSTVTKIKGFSTSLSAKAQEEGSGDEVSSSDDHKGTDDDDGEEGTAPSWVHRPKRGKKKHDLLARNPRAAKPEQLNELYLLRHYCDPEVARLARIISGEAMSH